MFIVGPKEPEEIGCSGCLAIILFCGESVSSHNKLAQCCTCDSGVFMVIECYRSSRNDVAVFTGHAIQSLVSPHGGDLECLQRG